MKGLYNKYIIIITFLGILIPHIIWSQAEINVMGAGMSILDGDTTPDYLDDTHFGANDLGSAPFEITYTIQNLGAAPLNIDDISLSGTGTGLFSIGMLTPTSPIPASGSATFIVTFTPSAIGNFNATINIANNDADEGNFTFAIFGEVIDPNANIRLKGNDIIIMNGATNPNTADHTEFGSITFGAAPIKRTFTIENIGGDDLEINAINISGSGAAAFSISDLDPMSPVFSFEFALFDITFNPASIGVFDATIQILSNDADAGTYSFSIRGTAACPNVSPAISSGNKSICAGQAIPALEVTVANGHTADWYDAPTGGNLLSANSLSYTPMAAGTFYALAKNTGNNCTANTRTAVSLIINDLPTLNIGATNCANDLNSYSVDIQTNTSNIIISSTAGTPVNNNNGNWVINNIPKATNITVTATNSSTNCAISKMVTAPNCACPNINPATSSGDKSICAGQAIPTLEVTVANGQTTDWYDAPTGGNLLRANSLSYTPMAAGTFYALAKNTGNNCTANTRTAVSLTINDLPILNIGSTNCANDLSSYSIDIQTNTSNIVITATAGIPVNNNNGNWAINNIPTGTNITVTATNSNSNCTISKMVTAPNCACPNINPATSSGDKSICAGQTIPTLEVTVANGQTTDWYDAPTGGNLLRANSLSYTPMTAGTFYALAKNTGNNCTANTRTAVSLIINDLPTLNIGTTNCANDLNSYSVDIQSNTSNIVITATAGIPVNNNNGNWAINNIPTGTNITVTATNSNSNCTISKMVTAPNCACPNINPATSSGDKSICTGQAIPTLEVTVANGQTTDWYDAPTGGNLLRANSLSYTPMTAGTFYALAKNTGNNCTANTRTAVTLTINDLPTLNIGSTNCANNLSSYSVDIQTNTSNFIITSTAGTPVNNNGNWTINNIPTATNITVTATNSSTNCTISKMVTAPDCACPNINPATSSGDKSICAGQAIPALEVTVANGQTVDWYDAPTGGNLLSANSLSYTPMAAGTLYALARNSINNCTAATRTPITLTINDLPTLNIGTANCAPDLASYSVDIQTNTLNTNITTTAGIPLNNGNGNWSVLDIPKGVNIEITARNTLSNCSNTKTMMAPACACPNIPPAISNGDKSICTGEAKPSLIALAGTGQTTDWYDAAAGGNLLQSNSLSYTPTKAGTYYAEARDIINNCIADRRTAITLSILEVPFLNLNTPECTADLSSYSVDIQTNIEDIEITATAGTPIKNTNGNWRIINIPKGMDISISVQNKSSNCSITKDLAAPDCACPSIPLPTSNGDKSICDGDLLPVLSVNVADGQTADWYDAPNGGTLLKTNSLHYTPNTAGVYYAEARDTVNNCISNGRRSVALIIHDLPKISTEIEQTICLGTSINLNVFNEDTTQTLNYQWLPTLHLNDNNIAQPIATPSQTTTYTVTASNEFNCIASDSVTIIINQINAGSISNDQTICQGVQPASIQNLNAAAGLGSIAYQWQLRSDTSNFSNIAFATEEIYTPPIINEHQYYRRIALSSFNDIGCQDTSNIIKISVNRVEAGIIGSNQILCKDEMPQAFSEIESSQGLGQKSYQWQVINEKGTIQTIETATNATYQAPTPIADTSFFRRIDGISLNEVVCYDTTNSISIIVNQIKAGIIGDHETICANDSPSLLLEKTPAIATGNLSYQWYSSTDSIHFQPLLNAQNPTFLPQKTATNSYFKRVDGSTIQNHICVDSSNIISLQLHPIVQAPINNGNQQICKGDSLPSLSVQVPTNHSVDWYDDEGRLLLENSLSFEPNEAGTYLVVATNTENACSSDTSTAISFIINPLPIANAGTDQVYCQGETGIQLLGSGGKSYTWMPSQGLDNAQIANPIARPTTSQHYILKVVDDHNCMDYDSVFIASQAPPILKIQSNAPICNKEDLHLMELGGEAGDWTWTAPNGEKITGDSVTIPFEAVQAGDYTLLAKGVQGCSSTDSLAVNLSGGIHFDANLLSNGFACLGDSIHFFEISSTAIERDSFFWNFGDGHTSAERDPIHFYTAAGTYPVSLKVTKEGCENISEEKMIRISPCRKSKQAENILHHNVYPSTSYGRFEVELELEIPSDISIEVYDLRGQRWFSQQKKNHTRFQETIFLQKAGMYLVYMRTSVSFPQNTLVSKIIVLE